MTDEERKIMDIEGLAKYLNLSKSTAYKLAQEGSIPGQKVGKHWRFRLERINEWLDEERPKNGGEDAPEKDAAAESQPGGGLPQGAGQDTGSSGNPPFGGIFTAEQLRKLKKRWIESPGQLLSLAASPSGFNGLRKLLGLSEEEFSGVLGQLQKLQGLRGGAESFSPAPEKPFGLRIENVPVRKDYGRDDEE